MEDEEPELTIQMFGNTAAVVGVAGALFAVDFLEREGNRILQSSLKIASKNL